MEQNKFYGRDAVLWYNKIDNELVLVARGSGDNLDGDRGLPANAPLFYGLDAHKLWADWCDASSETNFYTALSRKLSKRYAFLADQDTVREKWVDYIDDNVIDYDCETYALLFNLVTLKDGSPEHEAIVDAVEHPSSHTFDLYPSGFEIDDIHIDEDEAMLDGGQQTTFEKETPPVDSVKQLEESLGMCGVVFTSDAKKAEYLSRFKIIA